MTTRVRPHHLLCMLTFVGRGYTPAFVKNFEEIAGRIASGNETIEIVEAPDDICAALLAEPDCHCRNASVASRDRHAANALSSLLQQPIRAGAQLLLNRERLHALREAFAAGTIREACSGCQWKPLCDGIARDNFKETCILRPDAHAAPVRPAVVTPPGKTEERHSG